jgi:CubicO group peptidase (beta-lactamase class C family)
MCGKRKKAAHKRLFLIFVMVSLFASTLVGCGPNVDDLDEVDYTPLPGGDWQLSKPSDQGLDPSLVAELYYNASKVETIKSLLVIKNGYLVAEDYFHGGSVDQKNLIQSVTKSYISALVGLAQDNGCLFSIDQKMMDFFPELAYRIRDIRKYQITIRQMLQMRAGYQWEESSTELFDLMYSGFRPSNLVDVPLIRDPGTGFDYSNLTAHLVGVIVARACNIDLKSFGQENLFGPLNAEQGDWTKDWDGYYYGNGEMHLNARAMAKFGLLYLNHGEYNGTQILPADWVNESLQTYSENAWHYRVGRNFKDIGYGYFWWSIRAGDHNYHLAWGHGGQQIAVLDDLDMVIVVQADPLVAQHGDGPWKYEKANLNLVANFIASLPEE